MRTRGLSLLTAGFILWAAYPLAARSDDVPVVEGKTLHAWLRVFPRAAFSDRKNLAEAREVLLRYCGREKEAISALVKALCDRDGAVRLGAARFLGERPEGCREALPDLLRAAREDDDSDVRREALSSASDIAPDDPRVPIALVRALKEDEDPKVRAQAAYAFREVKPKPKSEGVTAALVEALNDKDHRVRTQAAYALAKIADMETTTTSLFAAIRRGEGSAVAVRPFAGAFSSLGAKAVPALCKALTDESANVRAGAVLALGYLHLDVPDARPAVQEAVPAVVRLLKDKESLVRKSVADSLCLIGNEDEATIKALIDALADPDRNVRYCSIVAIETIGPAAAAAVPSLIRLLKDSNDEGIRKAAARTLGAIGAAAKAAIPTLIEALDDKDLYVRFSAAHALGRIGPEAKAAVPALRKALESDSKELQRHAASALERINKGMEM
jgi:HEAT repeat protein